MSAGKTSQVNLRLSPALKARAEKAAERDHRSLTSLIEKLLADYLQGRAALENWHHQAQLRFESLASKRGQSSLLVPKKYFLFSFAVHTADGFELRPDRLLSTINGASHWLSGALSAQMFHVYTRQELEPYFTQAESKNFTGDTGEILESAIFPDTSKFGAVSFWRLTPNGLASYLSPYFEDRPGAKSAAGLEAGQWFCPFYMVRSLYELVLHASYLSQHFESAETVEFRCEWWGLKSREIADADVQIHWIPGKIAHEDHCVTRGEWDLEQLRNQPNIVSALAAPAIRLFDPTFDCSPDWIGQQTVRFKR